MQNTQIMDIVCDLLEEQQQNSIDCYEYDGIDLTLTEPIRMQSTILLTLFRPCSFLILRAKKRREMEYDEFHAKLEMLFAKGIEHKGEKYQLLGASSSLKNGKIWMGTKDVVDTIHQQFGSSQEALTYLGIYTSNCHKGIYEMEYPIQVVDDNYQVCDSLTTGDGEGYIAKDVLDELNLANRQIQVRLVSDTFLAKGTLHPYDGNKMIIPRSMFKGTGIPEDGVHYFLFGIREIARKLKFSSSWSLLQFFSKLTVESTLPKLNESLSLLEGVLKDRDKALAFLGSLEDDKERFQMEAFLKAGLSPKHPWLTSRLKKHLRNKYRQLALGSEVSITGYMASIADIDDQVICCVDLPSGEFVLTRYPIRDYLSFIKVKNDPTLVKAALPGSIYLSNNTVLQIDGDFDGDLLCIIDDPQFVKEVGNSKFGNGYKRLDEGNKTRKNDSLKLLPFSASEAISIGNKVGYLTYLINSSLLNYRADLLPILSRNLQLEVQSLKWATSYDKSEVRKIADELEIISVFRECKFNKRAFVSFVPKIPEKYSSHPLFIPYLEVQKRFSALDSGSDLMEFRYDLPIYDYDIAKYQPEAASVVSLYNGWISDTLESYEEEDPEEALRPPIEFLNRWAESKINDRKTWACTMWALIHKRSNGKSIGSAAFHTFPEVIDLLKDEPGCKSELTTPPELPTLRGVGGYFEMDGISNYEKLNKFRQKVKSLGRTVSIKVEQNEVDPDGRDFMVNGFRLGSMPRDIMEYYHDIKVGDSFDCFISQHGKVVYMHCIS